MKLCSKKNMLLYHAHKRIDFEDQKQIFQAFHQEIKLEFKKPIREQFQEQFLNMMINFNNFLVQITDDKQYVMFESLNLLVKILETCQNLDVIYITLEILMNIMSIEKKTCEDFFIGLPQEQLLRFILQIYLWVFNANYGNSSVKIPYKQIFYNNEDIRYFTLKKVQRNLTKSLTEDLLQKTHNVKKYDIDFKIDLEDLKNMDDQEMIEFVSIECKIDIKVNSILFLGLKMRRTIYESLVNEKKEINKENLQNLILSGINANIALVYLQKIQMFKDIRKFIVKFIDCQFLNEIQQVEMIQFEEILNIYSSEKQQIRSIGTMFSYYNHEETSKEKFLVVEQYIKKCFEKIYDELNGQKGDQQLLKSNNNLNVIYGVETVKQLTLITWLFYEDEEDRNSSQGTYSAIMDSIVGIMQIFSEDLEKQYCEEKVQCLAKIICLIKCEIHKDKDIVFLDLLVDLFEKHLGLYIKYKDIVDDYNNVLNSYIQFLFEILEAMFFYFLQPAKQKLILQIPFIARQILENQIWHSSNFQQLVKSDEGFLQIFNVTITLLNDLFVEIPENFVPSLLKKFLESGFIDMMDEQFLYRNHPCDFDVVCFYVKFTSTIYLHHKDTYTKERYEKNISKILDVSLNKNLVCNNIRRYLSLYVNETVKNLSSQLVECYNIDSSLGPFLTQQIEKFFDQLSQMENDISEAIIKSNTNQEFQENLCHSEILRQHGWFQYTNIPSNQEIFDDFYLFQQHQYNVLKFYMKFFDFLKSNFQKELLQGLKNNKVFDIIYKRKIIFVDDLLKIKTFKHSLGKMLNYNKQENEQLVKFKTYVFENLEKEVILLKETLDQMNYEEKRLCFQIIHKSGKMKLDFQKQRIQIPIVKITEKVYNFLNYYGTSLFLVKTFHVNLGINSSQYIDNLFKNQNNLIKFVDILSQFIKIVTNLMDKNGDIYETQLKQQIEDMCFDGYINKLKRKSYVFNINSTQKILKKNQSILPIDFYKMCDIVTNNLSKGIDNDIVSKKMLELSFNEQRFKELLNGEFGSVEMLELNFYLDQINSSINFGDILMKNSMILIKDLCEKKFFSNYFVKIIKNFIDKVTQKFSQFKNILSKQKSIPENLNVQDYFDVFQIEMVFDQILSKINLLLQDIIQKEFLNIQKPIQLQNTFVHKGEIQKLLIDEHYQMVIQFSQLFKDLKQQNLSCFKYLERDPNLNSKKKNSLKQNDEIQVDFSNYQPFKKFLTDYWIMFDLMLKTMKDIFPKQNGLSYYRKSSNLVNTAKEMGFSDELIKIGLEKFTNINNPQTFIMRLLELQSQKDTPQSLDIQTPFEVEQENNERQKYKDKMNSQISKIRAETVNYLIRNFFKYKELYKIIFRNYYKDTDNSETRKKQANDLIQTILNSIKEICGKKQQQSKQKNLIIKLENQKATLQYLLKFLNLLQNELIDKKDKDKPQMPQELFLFFNKILKGLFYKKYQQNLVSESITQIFKFFQKFQINLTQKKEILQSLHEFLQQYQKLQKQNEKSFLINEQTIIQMLELIIEMIKTDEKFCKELIYYDIKTEEENQKSFLKRLLRLDFKTTDEKQKQEIYKYFRIFVEYIIRQPQLIQILIESEIKNYFFESTDYTLAGFSRTFQNYMIQNRKIFTQIVQKVCITKQKPGTQNYSIMLKSEEQLPIKKYQSNIFIRDFIILLQNELLFQLDRKNHKFKNNKIFGDIFLAELIFYQILPRYPTFYLCKNKAQKFFTVVFFEKILNLHFGYLSFMEPLFYNSHFKIQDQNQVIPVSLHILHHINQQVLEQLLQILINLENDKKIELQKFINLIYFLLNSQKFLDFQNENIVYFNKVTETIEQILELINIKKIFDNKEISILLAMSDVLRRSQIVQKMNYTQIKEIKNQSQFLTQPKSFGYNLHEWTQKQENIKNFENIFLLTSQNNIMYNNFELNIINKTQQDRNQKIQNFLQNFNSNHPLYVENLGHNRVRFRIDNQRDVVMPNNYIVEMENDNMNEDDSMEEDDFDDEENEDEDIDDQPDMEIELQMNDSNQIIENQENSNNEQQNFENSGTNQDENFEFFENTDGDIEMRVMELESQSHTNENFDDLRMQLFGEDSNEDDQSSENSQEEENSYLSDDMDSFDNENSLDVSESGEIIEPQSWGESEESEHDSDDDEEEVQNLQQQQQQQEYQQQIVEQNLTFNIYPYKFPINISQRTYKIMKDKISLFYQDKLNREILCKNDMIDQENHQNNSEAFEKYNFNFWNQNKDSIIAQNNRYLNLGMNIDPRLRERNIFLNETNMLQNTNYFQMFQNNFGRNEQINQDNNQDIYQDLLNAFDIVIREEENQDNQNNDNNNNQIIHLIEDQIRLNNDENQSMELEDQNNQQNQEVQPQQNIQQIQDNIQFLQQNVNQVLQNVQQAQDNQQQLDQQLQDIDQLVNEQEQSLDQQLNQQNQILQEILEFQNQQQQLNQHNNEQNIQEQNQPQQNIQEQNQPQQNQQEQNIEEQNQPQQNQQEQIEIIQENNEQNENEFNFRVLGLPDDFLIQADIDPTFFYALPPDLQIELALQHGEALNLINPNLANQQPQQEQQEQPQQQEQQQQEQQVQQQTQAQAQEFNLMVERTNDNMIFLSSLDPNMREEVLMTCPDDFLSSLPNDVQQEARNLRQRQLFNPMNNMIFEGRTHNQNVQQPQNNFEQKLKQQLKKNKDKDLIQKVFPIKSMNENYNLFPLILNWIKNNTINLKIIPMSLLCSLLFDDDNQKLFYTEFFNVFDQGNKIDNEIRLRFLILVDKLTLSNYQYFHDTKNFEKLISIIKTTEDTSQLMLIVKITSNIIKSTVILTNKEETCILNISNSTLEILMMCLDHSSNKNSLMEYLSIILIVLSFKKENLEIIVESLQKGISNYALLLNTHLKTILDNYFNNQHNLDYIGKKFQKNQFFYLKFYKLFKLVEMLFTKSFNLNLQEEEKDDNKSNDENEEQKKENENQQEKFEKVKNQVLAKFQKFFDNETIRSVFVKVFSILNIYEHKLENLIKLKVFSKPQFFNLVPLVDTFFIIIKIFYDDESLQYIQKQLNINQQKKAQISQYKDNIKSEEEQSDKEFYIQNQDIPMDQIFNKGCKKNRKTINYMMKKVPKLTDSSFKIIFKKIPKILDFELKRKYFQQRMNQLKNNHAILSLKIRRDNLFVDSFTQLAEKPPYQFHQKLHIRFQGEEGEDAGGVSREWFQKLSQEIFNVNYALYIPAAHGYAFQPSPYSSVNPEHLRYFKFVGRIVGKALFDGYLLDAHFTKSFYKHMVNTPLNYHDFQDYDPDYYKNLKWLLENDINDLGMDLNFSYESNNFGIITVKPLKPNGQNIPVTNENKHEYIKLICYAKMANEIKPQIEAFLQGLDDVVNLENLKMFTAEELELMISGLPDIDIEDLRLNTLYNNYTKDSPLIKNFWKVLRSFDRNQKAGFLQFLTGTSKVPLEGFSTLKGIGGSVQKFSIHKAYDKKKLPTTHTCMNQLDLPEYESEQELRKKLLIAIEYGSEGFGFV